MSVTSSLYHFVDENGRTYHKYKDGKYMLPNDSVRDFLSLPLFIFFAFDVLYISYWHLYFVVFLRAFLC